MGFLFDSLSSGSARRALKPAAVLFILVVAAGIVGKVSIWDSALRAGFVTTPCVTPEFAADRSGPKTGSERLFVGTALEAWRNGSLSGRQLHVELGLKNAVIPAIYNCFSAPYKGLEREEGQPCFYVRTPIPVIGMNTVNNPKMLRRLVLSIDVPVQVIIIVVNTIPGEAGKQDELDMMAVVEELQDLIGRTFFKVIRSGCNRGCAGGWNTIIHSSLSAPWWLIINDDAAFVPGALRTLYDYISSTPEVAVYKLTGFRVFVMTQLVVAKVGVFDENIWPAYAEDCDFDLRIQLSGVLVAPRPPEFTNIHGDLESGASSSLVTSRGGGHPDYGRRNQCSHTNNRMYYQKKWNLSVQSCGRQFEGMFLTPHGNPSRNLASWTFDRALRARSETCWDPANSIDKWVQKDGPSFFAEVALPGDIPVSDCKEGLVTMQPNGMGEVGNVRALLKSGLKKPPCVSPFAGL